MHAFKCQQLQHKLNWCSGNCCEKTVCYLARSLVMTCLVNRSVCNLITRLEYGLEQWNGLWNFAEVTIFHCIIASFILFHSLHGGSIDASQFKAELTINRLGRKI